MTTVAVETPTDPFDQIVGQERAVADLRSAAQAPVHAYVFVGPHGSGKRSLARAFAAALLCDGLAPDDAARAVDLALAGRHPDVVLIEREGASITAEQAREVRDLSARAPVEANRKVLVLDEFHLVQENVGPMLLKTIEEPPPSTVFLLLMEDVPPHMATVESRCVRIDLGPVSEADIQRELERAGIEESRAAEVAGAAGGDVRRARVLATDPQLARRREAWHAAPERLDGTGHVAVSLVDELLDLIDAAAEPLRARHVEELSQLEERVERYGERGSGRRKMEERHKRELRRHRTDELRFGLAVLARRYRDAAVSTERPAVYLGALTSIDATAEGLARNPNERLQLQALVMRLPALRH